MGVVGAEHVESEVSKRLTFGDKVLQGHQSTINFADCARRANLSILNMFMIGQVVVSCNGMYQRAELVSVSAS